MRVVKPPLTKSALRPETGCVRTTGCSALGTTCRVVVHAVAAAVDVLALVHGGERPPASASSAPTARRRRRTCWRTACRRPPAAARACRGCCPSAARGRRRRRSASSRRPRAWTFSSAWMTRISGCPRAASGARPDGRAARRTAGRTSFCCSGVRCWSRKKMTPLSISAAWISLKVRSSSGLGEVARHGSRRRRGGELLNLDRGVVVMTTPPGTRTANGSCG